MTPRRRPPWTLLATCLASLAGLGSASAQQAESAPTPPAAQVASEPAAAAPRATPGAAAAAPSTEVAPASPDALLAELSGELPEEALPATDVPTGLALYGFADFGFYKYFLPPGSLLLAQVYGDSSFAVGNLNTYISGELGSGWRTLMEIRFTYLPNGSRPILDGDVQRVSTQVTDYTTGGRFKNSGSIFIERAWVEYTASPALTLRAGSWLTPYGYWNEDHGSPTLIPVARPYMIGLELLPERQTGLQLRGSFYASESVTLGYRVGLSNGRGPVADYADLDENKAVTLRLQLHHHGSGSLDVGAFAYGGRSTNTRESLVATENGFLINEQIVEQLDELAWGLDGRYVLGGLHLQSELIVHERAFTERGRPARGNNQYMPDERRFGGYLLAGYRFDWLALMPYLTAEYFTYLNGFELSRPPTRDIITDYALGLNSRPTDNVTLKLEGNLGLFFIKNADGSAFEHPLKALQAQIAWAF